MHQNRREALEQALFQQIEGRGDFNHIDGSAVDTEALQDDIRDLLNSYYGMAEAHRQAEADLSAFSMLA